MYSMYSYYAVIPAIKGLNIIVIAIRVEVKIYIAGGERLDFFK